VQPGGGVDPRRVWELNRLHHLVELGRAYALTRDEHYAEEFTVQIANWYDQNPPRFGINWAVAMEAGIRAVNIIAALELFRSSTAVSDRVIAMILKLLLSHGRFIRSNLERSRFGSSNHYLGDLIGLLAIGAAVPELEPGRRWLKFAAKEIRREINDQVLSDGVDYEGSVAYHRLVVEMFSLALMLCEGAGLPRDPQYRRRLRAMLEFTRSYLKPDGTAPAIGDSDDGRVLKFTEKDPLDHRYLLPLGAILLEDRQLLNASAFEEETIWWLGAKAGESFPREPGPKVVHLQAIQAGTVESAAFAEAQIFIQRSGDLYAIVDCGDHGLKGNGSHAHSDALSFELYAHGSTFLRDPGTYVYSASARRRNLFRSTPYHNTVRVDGLDISPIPPDQMFALGRNVKPKINNWSSTRERDVLDAEHHGYTGLGSPVVHRRIVSFEKIPGYWRVRDLFTGEGEHLFEFFFNFDAGMRASLEADGRAVVRGPNASLVIIPLIPVAFESRLVTRWISPAYGTRLRSSGIIYSLRAPVTLETAMLLVPAREEDQSKPARVLEHATKAPGDH
jgi:hypothetical protein